MKTMVTNQGVIIPMSLLNGIKEVEIRKEKDRILVIPVIKDDPIFKIGKNPIICNIYDASEKHNNYLYGDTNEPNLH